MKECVFVIYRSFAQSSNQEMRREHDSLLWRVWSEDRDGWWERVTWGLISGAGAWHYVHCTMCHWWPVQELLLVSPCDQWQNLILPGLLSKIYSLPLLNDYHTLSTNKHLNGSVHHRTVCFQYIRKKKQRLKLSRNPDQEWNWSSRPYLKLNRRTQLRPKVYFYLVGLT